MCYTSTDNRTFIKVPVVKIYLKETSEFDKLDFTKSKLFYEKKLFFFENMKVKHTFKKCLFDVTWIARFPLTFRAYPITGKSEYESVFSIVVDPDP